MSETYPGFPEVDDTPVRVGSILFTIVEPHKGHEVDYNRWYETDHLYAGCTVGPYNFAARRWVSTAPLKKLRNVGAGEINDDPMVGSYLATYWVQEGHRDDWNKWAFREFRWLHENDRMFPHRDHVHTQLYDVAWVFHREPEGVPAALALDHPYKGIAVTIGTASGDHTRDEVEEWYRREYLPDVVTAESAISQVIGFVPVPLQVDAKDVDRSTGDEVRFLRIAFLDQDPADCWDQVAGEADALASSGLGEVLWQGPFIPTIPGTTTYTDQLW
jgi:hypothetical protein